MQEVRSICQIHLNKFCSINVGFMKIYEFVRIAEFCLKYFWQDIYNEKHMNYDVILANVCRNASSAEVDFSVKFMFFCKQLNIPYGKDLFLLIMKNIRKTLHKSKSGRYGMRISALFNNSIQNHAVFDCQYDLNHEATMIVREVYNLSYSDFFLKQNDIIDIKTIKFLCNVLSMRLFHIPLAKILKTAYFIDKNFYVNFDVLDPRQETECLVNECISIVKNMQRNDLKILELGVGSGCVLLSVVSALSEYYDDLSKFQFLGYDLSRKALNIAMYNAYLMNILHIIKFYQSDWFDIKRRVFSYGKYCTQSFISNRRASLNILNFISFTQSVRSCKIDHLIDESIICFPSYNNKLRDFMHSVEGYKYFNSPAQSDDKFDIIISNPPYIGGKDCVNYETMCDPAMALFAQNNGTAEYEKILFQAADFLNENGFLILEIGSHQGFLRHLPLNRLSFVRCIKDLNGDDRVLVFAKKTLF